MDTDKQNKSVEFLRDVMQRMNTQDNRCTATPYFYQIENFKNVTSIDGDFEWVLDCEENVDCNEDLNKYLMEHHEEKYKEYCENIAGTDYVEEDLCEFEVECLFEELGYYKWHYERKSELIGFFLTEDAAKHHMEINGHNYSHDARTYVSHAFRSPEFEQFLKAVGEIVGVEYKRK